MGPLTVSFLPVTTAPCFGQAVAVPEPEVAEPVADGVTGAEPLVGPGPGAWA